MIVEELMDLLDELDPETEIRIAHQPRWPFEYELRNAGVADINGKKILYLAEGDQLDYLPQAAREAIGW